MKLKKLFDRLSLEMVAIFVAAVSIMLILLLYVKIHPLIIILLSPVIVWASVGMTYPVVSAIKFKQRTEKQRPQ